MASLPNSIRKNGRERGWGPMTYEHYDNEVQNGSLYVGSPETVAQKIIHAIESTGANRFDLKYSNGPMPHQPLDEVNRAIRHKGNSYGEVGCWQRANNQLLEVKTNRATVSGGPYSFKV